MTMTTIARATLATAVLAGPATAQEVRWDMANEYQATSIHGMAQTVFTDTAAELSGGAIRITNHFGASLGYTSGEHFDAVADGALPIANTSMGQVAGIEPIFLLSSLPFLANSPEQARLLWEVARPWYEKVFARNNQVLLYASPWPPAGIWGEGPVTSAEALSGLRIRAWDASGTTTLVNAGAAAIQLPWADVMPQLAAGGIEAVLTSAEGGVNAKFHEHLTDFTEINYSMSLNMTHVNADAWNGLTDGQRSILLTAAEAASEAAWGTLAEQVARNYADMKANGITVTTDVPEAFLALLTRAGQDVHDGWLEDMGETGQAILDAYFAARQDG